MSAPLRPSTTRGLLSVCFSPFEGPDRILSTTFAFSGSRSPGSGGGKFRFELLAFALANEGSGDITTVESTRRLRAVRVLNPPATGNLCYDWKFQTKQESVRGRAYFAQRTETGQNQGNYRAWR